MSAPNVNGRKPLSAKRASTPILTDDIFGNRLALSPEVQKDLKERNLVARWINANELPVGLVDFPNARFLGITGLEWVSLIALVLGWFLVHQSRFGREIRALGGNPNAAKYVGIPETKRLFALYALSGVVAGVVGVLWVARFALANTEIASGFELQVVAACVLGGVSIAGGVGSVIGTALGAIFLTTLYNALPVVNVSPFWQTAIVGVAILVAAIVNQGASRVKGKTILRRA